MDLIIKKASALSNEEKIAIGIVGIPDNWPVESFPYTGVIPAGFELMSDLELTNLKDNNQAAYDAWLYVKRPINPPYEGDRVVIVGNTTIPKTTTGLQKVAIYEPEGDSATIVTFNFTDKCSWYVMAPQVVGEILSTSDYLVYTSSHTYWIDLTHGRCYDEDNIMLINANKWIVNLYIDDVKQVVNDSIWTVNYEEGKIVFATTTTGVVKVDFSYATTSYYILKPKTGKILSIKTSELQFSSNVQIISPIYFEVWFSSHPVYGTMPIPGTKIVYKNAKDLISACNGGQGLIPKCIELTYDVHVFPFDYARPKPLKSAQYLEIRAYTKDHIPLTGEFATGTFYVAIDTE